MQLRPWPPQKIALVLMTGTLVGLASVHAHTRAELRQTRQALKLKAVAIDGLLHSLNEAGQKDGQELFILRAAAKREEEDQKAIEGWGRVTQRPFIPPIATVAGVQVGRDTIERLEQRFGPGYPYTGGHPQGARKWRSPKTGAYIDADGFNYTPHKKRGLGERVLDFVSIRMRGSLNDPKAAIPSIPASQDRRLLFMGCVSLGMTRQQVRKALEDKLPAPQIHDGGYWVWTAKGYWAPNHHPGDTVYEWTATLTFEDDRLTGIDVCD